MAQPYTAACIQSVIREIRDPSVKDEVILENTNRILSMVDYATGRFGNAKLVVLPEFCLQGFDHFDSVDQALGTCITIPGPETDRLAEAAVERGIYIAGAAFETDPDWPGRWFNTAFLIAPDGQVVLRYRKIHCGSVVGGATNTSPADVLTEYLERYGVEGLFPVVDTPLGKIGMMICYDVSFPEVARCLAMRGAELILHPTGEPYSVKRGAWREAKHTRAFENRVYFLSANHGAYFNQTTDGEWTDASGLIFQSRQRGEIAPTLRSHGRSELIDYDGKVMAEIDGPGEAVISADIEIESLRYHRGQRSRNLLAQHMPQIYADIYASTSLRPVDQWRERPIQDRKESSVLLADTIARLQESGFYERSVLADADAERGGGAHGGW